ncbi:MAG: hypothetical protein ACTSRG_21655 [Candidatus Helarchaeota archaeon]
MPCRGDLPKSGWLTDQLTPCRTVLCALRCFGRKSRLQTSRAGRPPKRLLCSGIPSRPSHFRGESSCRTTCILE